ncbi:MAG: hypothetical protein P4M13_12135 [Alphaproteobacteria bacterium]|nr:hypothetical protein [Alphaproteobacteria bacterium]
MDKQQPARHSLCEGSSTFPGRTATAENARLREVRTAKRLTRHAPSIIENRDDKLIELVKWLLAILQVGSAAFILSALFHALRGYFNAWQVHPDDLSLPFSLQRIGGREDASKYPRRNYWLAIALFSLGALIWLIVFYYAGLLVLYWG